MLVCGESGVRKATRAAGPDYSGDVLVEVAHSAELREGGVIAVDNVLWDGKVADPEDTSESTVDIRAFNLKLHADERVSISMLPLADGLTLARKR